MAEGLTPDLVFAAVCVWLFGMALTWRKLPLPLAISITLLKVAIPVIYFAGYYDGTWTTVDDLQYQREGSGMLQMGFTPLTALTTVDGLAYLGFLSGGEHILYGWWNLLGQYLFGMHYWSPVFLNVGLTFVAGAYLVRILELLGFDAAYRRGMLVFFLLNWDVLAWSSLLNVKDTLVMTITVIGLLSLIHLTRGVTLRRLIAFALVAALFTWIRFYLTFLMLIALAFWVFFQWRDRRKFLFLGLVGAGLFVAFLHLPTNLSGFAPASMPFGLFMILLTPQPGNIDVHYTFLTLPGLANLMMFGPMLIGAFALWRRGGAARLPIVYMVLAVLFYSVVPELAGPRQRFQLVPIYAWLQFHALWMVFRARRTQAHPADAVSAIAESPVRLTEGA